MATCSIFKNFTVPVEKKSLLIIGKDIISDKCKAEVEEIRNLIAEGNKEAANEKKKTLLAFTPSAVFTEKRQMPFLEMYSGFVHLDFDKLTPDQLKTSFAIISKIPYTALCFISPSGNGLKVFVEVSTELEYHDIAYQQVQKYYEDATGLNADPSCKDVTRLCFMSHDPSAYRNVQSEKFIVALPQFIQEQESQTPTAIAPVVPIETAEPENLNITFLFNQQIQFTNQKTSYTDGNRNNYIYLLASNCNRVGLSQSNTEILCCQHFDLPHSEIKAAIKSAFEKHPHEFAKFAKSATMQTSNTKNTSIDDDLEDFLKSTPTIPDEIFELLPDILRSGSAAFDEVRKRDVFFTGALAILSGCLPNVTGIYHQERVYTHLFTFIIAPPASGKGVLKNAKRLADKFHQKVLAESREIQKKYDAEMLDHKTQTRQLKKGETAPEQPTKPPFKIVFIPADSSHARMIEHLQMNEGQGIICETEADTMSGAKKQDWGDYSPALRAAFHHEKITLTRKTNNEYIEINEPRLAVALSGTPAQAPRLISSAEDGLFSRFLFYAFKNNLEWQDPSPMGKPVVYNDHFDMLSVQVLNLIDFLEQSPTEIQLTAEQWGILNTTFTIILSDVTTFTSEAASGVVYRLGLVLYRICMIFTALRKFEMNLINKYNSFDATTGEIFETAPQNNESNSVYICSDQDFNTALKVVKTYLSHSILMFNNLPHQGDNIVFQGGDSKRKLFESLPDEFTRKEAVAKAQAFNLSARSVDEILRMGLGHTLTKPKAGLYQKIQ